MGEGREEEGRREGGRSSAATGISVVEVEEVDDWIT